jgi:diguanylate cyclase (GGDEF)-like protein
MGARLPIEDSFYDLLIDTLDGLEQSARGPFLQRLLKSLTQLDLSESLSLEYWDCTLERRRELADILGRPVSLKTALVDFLAGTNALRIPILMEYDELKKLQINAATDPLTGLYNRRFFDEYFEKELNRAKRYEHHLALISLDLHRFKDVNDRFGHLKGDQVLQLAATTLRSSMRTSDYAFRIGGDEFAMLLPQSDREQAATLGRRVRANFLAAIAPLAIDSGVSFDYGLAVHPEDGDQTEILMHVADQRLYRMKGVERDASSKSALEEQQQAAATSATSAQTPEAAAPERTPEEIAPQLREEQRAAEAAQHEAEAARPEPLPEKPASTVEKAMAAAASAAPVASTPNRRRAERVSLVETKAHAQFAGDGETKLRVLDISSGGVALEADANFSPQETIQAVLHVPILPAVRVKLKPVYLQKISEDRVRVGCAFVA